MLTSDAIRLVALNFGFIETHINIHQIPVRRHATSCQKSEQHADRASTICVRFSPRRKYANACSVRAMRAQNVLPYGPRLQKPRRPAFQHVEGNALGFSAFRGLTLSSDRCNNSGTHRPCSARCSAVQWGPPCSGPRNGPYPAAPRRQKDIRGPGVDLFFPTRRRR